MLFVFTIILIVLYYIIRPLLQLVARKVGNSMKKKSILSDYNNRIEKDEFEEGEVYMRLEFYVAENGEGNLTCRLCKDGGEAELSDISKVRMLWHAFGEVLRQYEDKAADTRTQVVQVNKKTGEMVDITEEELNKKRN